MFTGSSGQEPAKMTWNWRRFHNYEFDNQTFEKFSVSTIPFDCRNNRSILFDYVRLSSIINLFDYVRLPIPGMHAELLKLGTLRNCRTSTKTAAKLLTFRFPFSCLFYSFISVSFSLREAVWTWKVRNFLFKSAWRLKLFIFWFSPFLKTTKVSFSFSVSKSGFHTTVSVPDSAMPQTVPQHHLGHDSGYLF